jgi:hypothetical protein
MAPIPKFTEAEIGLFYKTEGHNFRRPEMVHAAHILKHVRLAVRPAKGRSSILWSHQGPALLGPRSVRCR